MKKEFGSKPVLGIMGLSDGDKDVHEQLKGIVQAQVDAIVKALRDSGEVEVIEAQELVCSVKKAKEQAEYLKNQGVDGTILSYGVFAFPNFSAIAAQNGKGPFLLAANLNPDWPGMVAMLAAGGALNHLGIRHFRASGDVFPKNVLDKYIRVAQCARVVRRLQGP